MLYSSGGTLPLGRPSIIGDGIGLRGLTAGDSVALFARTWEQREALLMKKRGPERGTAVPETAPIVEEDATPVAPDRSGWTPHPSERRDFWNRIRAFPPRGRRLAQAPHQGTGEKPGTLHSGDGPGPGSTAGAA